MREQRRRQQQQQQQQEPPPDFPRRRLPWPGYGGGYLPQPIATIPFGDPAQWRCIQACMAGGAAPPSAPDAGPVEPLPAPAADAPADASPPAAPGAGAGAGAGDGAPAESEFEFQEIGSAFTDAVRRIGSGIGQGITKVGAALDGCKIIDLTARSDRSVRKGKRDPKTVTALVLHQMACCAQRRDPLRSYLGIKAHYAILRDGRILQLHPVSALVWASNGFNARSVAVEFAGNFPDVRGRWWEGERMGRDRVTPAQLEAGRCLVRHLKRTIGLKTVLAHRQSSNSRENDPGPDIWFHVGQWAVDKLGLRDGGPGFKVGTGKPILDAWRTWGRMGAGATKPSPELEFEQEYGYEQEDEGEVAPGLMSFDAAIADPRSAQPGIYTIYKDGQRVYVGRADVLKRRLLQHRWCLSHLKISPTPFSIKLTPMAHTAGRIGRVEETVIGRYGRSRQGGILANVRARELEAEGWH